jgi:hypothetical protein
MWSDGDNNCVEKAPSQEFWRGWHFVLKGSLAEALHHPRYPRYCGEEDDRNQGLEK